MLTPPRRADRRTNLRGVDAGFSFIELLAYMAIAALLILAAIPQFQNYRGAARDANTRDDVKSVAQAIESWSIDHPGEKYPYINVDWNADNGTLNDGILTSNGARLSKGTHLIVRDRTSMVATGVDPGQSYCISAYNPDGARWNGIKGNLNYDSAYGGLGYDCRSAPKPSASYAWTGTVGNSPSTVTVGSRVYRNLIPQTDCTAGGWRVRWFGSGGATGTTSCHAADSSMDRAYQRKTWTKVGGNQDIGTSAPDITITAGKTYTISAEARSTWPTTQVAFPTWLDASGNGLTAADPWWHGDHADAGEWKRVSGVVTAPAGAVSLRLNWGPYPLYADLDSKPSIGGTLDLAKPMVLDGAVDLPFFDGNTR